MWTEPLHLVVNGQQFSQKKKKEKKGNKSKGFLLTGYSLSDFFFWGLIESFRHNISGLRPRPKAGPVFFNIIIKETFS